MKYLALLLLAASAFGETVIYSNLNSDPTNVYNCCDGYEYAGFAQLAVPFTVPQGVHQLSRIIVAVQWVSESSDPGWSLNKDDNGVPGEGIHYTVAGGSSPRSPRWAPVAF
jgi:hypothetical protein